jgi:hypothetical protein
MITLGEWIMLFIACLYVTAITIELIHLHRRMSIVELLSAKLLKEVYEYTRNSTWSVGDNNTHVINE